MDVNFDYVIFTIEKKQKNVGFSSFGQLDSLLLLLLVGCYCSERFSSSAEEFCRLEGEKGKGKGEGHSNLLTEE